MNDSDFDFALMFKALGDPTRLRLFAFLRDQCCPVAVEENGYVSYEMTGAGVRYPQTWFTHSAISARTVGPHTRPNPGAGIHFWHNAYAWNKPGG